MLRKTVCQRRLELQGHCRLRVGCGKVTSHSVACVSPKVCFVSGTQETGRLRNNRDHSRILVVSGAALHTGLFNLHCANHIPLN